MHRMQWVYELQFVKWVYGSRWMKWVQGALSTNWWWMRGTQHTYISRIAHDARGVHHQSDTVVSLASSTLRANRPTRTSSGSSESSGSSRSSGSSVDRRKFLIAAPGMQKWAEFQLAPRLGATYMSTRHRKFPDGCPDLQFGQDIPGSKTHMSHLIVVVDGHNVDSMWRVNAFVNACRTKWRVDQVICVIPSMGASVMDRVDNALQICTSRVFAQMVQADVVVLMDPHAPHTSEFFKNDHRQGTPVVWELSAMPMLVRKIPMHAVIVLPDAGAYKRYSGMLDGFDTVTCQKKRSGDLRDVLANFDDDCVRNRDTYIVDDMIQTGNTLEACRIVLVNAGARSVSVVAVHAVLPNLPDSSVMTQEEMAAYGGNPFFRAVRRGDFTRIMVTDTMSDRGQNLANLAAATATTGHVGCTVEVVGIVDLVSQSIM